MSVRVRFATSPSPLRLVRPDGVPRDACPEKPLDLDATLPLLFRRPASLPREGVPLRCIRCDGRVERGAAPVHIERPGYRVAWEALPAWVCSRCEAPYFEEREVTLIRQALSLMKAAAGTRGGN